MKKILDYLGYFILAVVITFFIVAIGAAIIQQIIAYWPCAILMVLILNFLLVMCYCKEKKRSPWRIILNLKEKENPKDNI